MSASALALPASWGDETQEVFARLMAHAAGAVNDEAFAAMIATRAAGGGALPPWLGLQPAAFR